MAVASEPGEMMGGAGAGSASAWAGVEGETGFEVPLLTTSTSGLGALGAGLFVSETEMLVTAFFVVDGTSVVVAGDGFGNGDALTTAL